jgi:predicted enzyme related to lactoylglutathione lyase
MGAEQNEPLRVPPEGTGSASTASDSLDCLGSYGPDVWCWTELRTTDVARAAAFYGELFGWTAGEVPVAPRESYTVLRAGDLAVAAICPRGAGESPAPSSPHWRLYAALNGSPPSADPDARQASAPVGREPQLSRTGRWASPRLPLGAIFAAAQARARFGSDGSDSGPAVLWIDEGDSSASVSFLRAFLGVAEKVPELALANEGAVHPATGLVMLAGPKSGLPAWSVGFAVQDCDATIDRARALGGRVSMPVETIEHVGRAAAIEDPLGASFVCWQPQQVTAGERASRRARPIATMRSLATELPSGKAAVVAAQARSQARRTRGGGG